MVRDDAMTLRVDSVMIRHALKTDTIDLYDLNRLHKLIDYSNLNRIVFPNFAVHCRKI